MHVNRKLRNAKKNFMIHRIELIPRDGFEREYEEVRDWSLKRARRGAFFTHIRDEEKGLKFLKVFMACIKSENRPELLNSPVKGAYYRPSARAQRK